MPVNFSISFLQRFHARALVADDDAGLGGIDRNGDFVAGALNVDMRNARRVELFLEHFAQVEVFHQIVGKILLARIPSW